MSATAYWGLTLLAWATAWPQSPWGQGGLVSCCRSSASPDGSGAPHAAQAGIPGTARSSPRIALHCLRYSEWPFSRSMVGKMNWLTALALGACGGALVQAIAFFGAVQTWQVSRQRALARGRSPKPLRKVVDPPADLLVLLTRLGLGGVAGILFHAQITGAVAAIAVGASAPALLRQLGAVQSMAGADSLQGANSSGAASNQVDDPESVVAQDG